jgi:hypothetical protein
MNDIPQELRLFRTQLRDAIERDLHRRPGPRVLRRRSSGVAVSTLAALAAAGAAFMLLAGGGAQAPSANAAILRHTLAALTPPRGTILYEQAQISTPGHAAQRYALWAQADRPHAYRVIKWGHEASWNGRAFSTYNAATNIISMLPSGRGTVAARSHEPIDYAATLRSLVRSGQAQVAGTTTINGVKAYRLTVSHSPDPFLLGTVYVAASNYRPLRIQTVTYHETITFRAYKYLPSTRRNMSLLSLAAQHPGATVMSTP